MNPKVETLFSIALCGLMFASAECNKTESRKIYRKHHHLPAVHSTPAPTPPVPLDGFQSWGEHNF